MICVVVTTTTYEHHSILQIDHFTKILIHFVLLPILNGLPGKKIVSFSQEERHLCLMAVYGIATLFGECSLTLQLLGQFLEIAYVVRIS